MNDFGKDFAGPEMNSAIIKVSYLERIQLAACNESPPMQIY